MCNQTSIGSTTWPAFARRFAWHASCVLEGSNVRAAREPVFGSEGAEMDLLYIALTVGFFALSWAFVVACDRLS
jgi:hypothetical protein